MKHVTAARSNYRLMKKAPLAREKKKEKKKAAEAWHATDRHLEPLLSATEVKLTRVT